MELLVLGGTGFVGSQLCKRAEMDSIKYRSIGSKECDLLSLSDARNLFSTSSSPLNIVFMSTSGLPGRDSLETCMDNIRMTSNIIEALRGFEVETFIFFSSSDVYGRPQTVPVSEEAPLNPENWYGLSKLTSEKMLLLCPELNNVLTILRLPGIYTQDALAPNAFCAMYRKILESGKVTCFGDGASLRDIVEADELSKMVLHLSTHGKAIGVVNIATGESISVREAIEAMRRQSGRDIQIEWKMGNGRDFDLVLDISKLKNMLPDILLTPFKTVVNKFPKSI